MTRKRDKVEVPAAVSENGRSGDDRDEADDGLSPEETRFVDAITRGDSLDEAATALDKSARTLRRWRKKPAVAAAIQARMSEAMALSRAILASGANRAARELEKLCSSAEPDAARIAACKAVIEFSSKLGELASLEERLTELEAKIERIK